MARIDRLLGRRSPGRYAATHRVDDAPASSTLRLPQPAGHGEVHAVHHGLGTRDVTVTCLDDQGAPTGYLIATAVDDDDVEVITATGVRTIVVRADTPDNVR